MTHPDTDVPYSFIHPLCRDINSNTYKHVSTNVVSDLGLMDDETDVKLYDVILNNIETLKSKTQPFRKTRSQQRVYDEITNNYFTEKKDISLINNWWL